MLTFTLAMSFFDFLRVEPFASEGRSHKVLFLVWTDGVESCWRVRRLVAYTDPEPQNSETV